MALIRLLLAAVLAFTAAGSWRVDARTPAAASLAQTDLDAFMARVLSRRDENWKKLRQYVLDEREEIAVTGPSGAPLWGQARDYTWFIRDGVFVRSPVRVNGVVVPEAERRDYEERFAQRAREREEQGGADSTAGTPADVPASAEALLAGASRPQFIDTAYFLRFEFEPGRYALVGRETFDGREVLRIEHYPERLFSHEQEDEERRQQEGERNPGEDAEAAAERMMNKVSLVTLWVLPDTHQIVQYTFDNVDLDFLPAAWLLRVTDLRASMVMSEPFPDVWLPARVEMQAGMLFAFGPMSVRYTLGYHDYREASTSGRVLPVGPQ